MKPIPWPHLAAAIDRSKKGDRAAAALIAQHVETLVAEAQAKRAPECDFRARMDAFKARHPAKPLPAPASPTPPPAPYQERDPVGDYE